MKVYSTIFLVVLVLSMTTSSALNSRLLEPTPLVFAQESEPIEFSGKFVGKQDDGKFRTLGTYFVDDEQIRKVVGTGSFEIQNNGKRCNPLTATQTLDVGDESVNMNINGEICSQKLLSQFRGTFDVTGGSGKFERSTGSGSISVTIIGTFFGGSLQGTITLDQAILLALDYEGMLSEFESIGDDLQNAQVTPEYIENINSKLMLLQETVIKLQNNGYDGKATTQVVSGKTIGSVSFFNKETSELLFETQISDETLAVFYAFGLISEFQDEGIVLTIEEQTALIHSALLIVRAITNFEHEDISSFLVLASIGAFHPSTGNTFLCGNILNCIKKIGKAVSKCLNNKLCDAVVDKVLEDLLQLEIDNAYKRLFPAATISILKFHDLNVNGFFENGELGLEDWRFVVFAHEEPDTSDPLSFLSDTTFVADDSTSHNGELSFEEIRVPRFTIFISVSEIPQLGWQLTSLEGVTRDLPFNADVDVPILDDVKVYPRLLFGNVEEGAMPPIDTDNDGILDNTDSCIDEPETMNGYEDEDGCPDLVPPPDPIPPSNVYLVDFENNKVRAFTLAGDLLYEFGSYCEMKFLDDPELPPELEGICNTDALGAVEPGDGQFLHPSDIATDSVGNPFVLDAGNNRVQKFDGNDGTFLLKWTINSDPFNDPFYPQRIGIE